MKCIAVMLTVVVWVMSAVVASDTASDAGLSLVPWPQQITRQAGASPLGRTISVRDAALKPLAHVLTDEIERATGCTLTIADTGGDIVLAIDPALKPESYTFTSDGRITIHGGDYTAVAHATATLLQLLEGRGEDVTVPHVQLNDEPAYGYRGVMIDVARKAHSLDTLRQAVELCRLYKIRYVHLHLNDNQGWTFPSTVYPQLGTKNQYRIPRYTVSELTDLVRFADERGVTLIPEIDTPGHCGAAMRAAPEIFGTTGPDGKPRGLPVMNLASEKTYEALHTILGEVAAIFKSSPYIHIGCDEVNLAGLGATPEAKRYMQQHPQSHMGDLFLRHIVRMSDEVKALGKQAIIWESFHGRGNARVTIPEDVIVMPWANNRNPAPNLVKHGYRIINAGWSPLYILRDLRFDAEAIYDWNATAFGKYPGRGYDKVRWLHVEPTPLLMGASLYCWEQAEQFVIDSIRQRAPAMNERLWQPESDLTFASFERRWNACDQLLDRLITPVRIRTDGLWNPDPEPHADRRWRVDHRLFEQAITVTLSTARSLRSDERIHYTLDGSQPTAASPVYEQPLHLSGDDCQWTGKQEKTVTLHARLFRKGVPIGYASRQQYRYDTIAHRPRRLRYTLYEVRNDMTVLPNDTRSLKVIQRGQAPWWDMSLLPRVPFTEPSDTFAIVFEGRIALPAAGVYHLRVSSQGGRSQLFIDSQLVINRTQADWSATGADAQLKAGAHDIKLIYVGRGRHLKLVGALDKSDEYKPLNLLPLNAQDAASPLSTPSPPGR